MKTKASQPEGDYLSFVNKLNDNPTALFVGNEAKTKNMLRAMLQNSFQTQNTQQNSSGKKIVFENFGLDQVWQQIVHHTETLNRKTLNKLEKLTMDEEFVKRLDEEVVPDTLPEEESEPEADEEEMDEEGEMEMEEEGEASQEDFQYGDEEELVSGADDQDLDSEQLDDHMEDIEEMDEVHEKLKIPKDLEGHGGDRFDMDADEDDEEEAKAKNEDSDDPENDIFAQARENQELKFANEDMLDKIKKIENEMMDDKKWQMKGEIQC